VKSWLRNPLCVFGLVLLWRVLLLVLTAQPIPGDDAFSYDGPVVNFLHTGRYCNPSLAVTFPIAGTEIYAMYPPLYQGALLVWMKLFGTSVISAMTLHLALFAVSGLLTLAIIRRFFPASAGYAVVVPLFLGFTFDDRPESLAFVFGMGTLWLVARQISGDRFRVGTAAGLVLALLLGLYTSVIVGAYFFGTGFLACAAACWWRRKIHWFAPFILAAVLFAVIAFSLAKLEPRWWAGFMENARQTTTVTNGLHVPYGKDIVKLIRIVPVFLLALAMLPQVITRRKEIFSGESAWLALVAGIFAMGWVLLVLSVALLASYYVTYAIFTQIILGAGLLALAQKYFPERERFLQWMLLGCVLLISIRAIGMTTWGAACAWKNSYQNTQAVLRTELEPFVTSDKPVLVSAPFLYCAAEMGVKHPIDCTWYFDHANWTNNAQIAALIRLQPSKLVLDQFNYYRSFTGVDQPVLDQLRQHPELVEIHVRNLAAGPVPDAIPSLQRVVQHISWAPVIVDLDWKKPPPP
jgi:hypothetical protein